ncbi:MAG: NifB/NifX family molybdenum-iron cluster-binding protein [Desulfocurvibacter africanus]
MKIAVSTQGNGLDSPLDPRFGRASGFVIVDSDTLEHTYVPNAQNMSLSQGAGIQAAQCVANAGAKAVITGHVGPKAYVALDRGKIAVYLRDGGTAREALEAFKAGSLAKAGGPDKDGHW